MNNSNEREFDLGSILNMTTGLYLTSWDDICELASFLLGRSVYILELVFFYSEMRNHILSIYPQLSSIDPNVQITSYEEAQVFIQKQKAIYGNSLVITPIGTRRIK